MTHKPKKLQPFAFIGDLLTPNVVTPYRVDSDFSFDKASEEQVLVIKQFVDGYFHNRVFSTNPYEIKEIPTPDNPKSFTIEHLKKQDWNYYVLNYFDLDPSETSTFNVELAAKLSSLDLTLILDRRSDGSIAHHTLGPPIFYAETFAFTSKSISEADLLEIRNYYSLLKEFAKNQDQFPDIAKAHKDIIFLKGLSKRSPFKIIGVFAILELLLTTDDRQREASITSQLRSKISLLNNRSKWSVDFKKYFRGPDTLTLAIIIETLYKYRSEIAHGRPVDFTGKFQIINGDGQLEFLMLVLKMVFLESLIDPQLVSDLKNC